MSVGLLNNATQQVQPYPAQYQPMGAAPSYGQPQMTAHQAVMMDPTPQPPHAGKENATGIEFSQAVKGIHVYYARFRSLEAAYNMIQAVLAGKQDPPIVRIPTGEVDAEGQQIVYELDLKGTLPERVSEDERLVALRKQIGPWNNYIVAEYRKCVSQLLRAAGTVDALLTPPLQQQQAPPNPPGQRIIQAPQLPPMS
jgi:hypothetical protein